MKKRIVGALLGVVLLAQGAFAQGLCSAGDGEIAAILDAYGVTGITTAADAWDWIDTNKEWAQLISRDLSAGAAANTQTLMGANTAILGGVAKGLTGSTMSLGGGYARNDRAFRSADSMAAVASSGYDCGWELWVQPFANWTRMSAGTWYAGHKTDTYGFNIAAQKAFDFGKAGLFAGYSHTAFETRGISGMGSGYIFRNWGMHSNNWTLGAFGDFNVKNFAVTAILGHTWNRLHDGSWRNHANTWFHSLKVGYDFCLSNGLTLTPSIGWRYTHMKPRGAGALYSSQLPFLAKLAYDSGNGKFYVEGGYIREVSHRTVYKYGRPLSNDLGTIGAGYEGNIGRFDWGIDYDYQFDTRGTNSHTLALKFGIKF
ncbi:MAG: autotransporter outer membrane beta-barrel domain-containing protein [Promicromonosporaceae bacterium]|nr:autotransporter outer membrane beta-barrel domain-containing protein [Promicromonosporaceae bacterium]